MASQGFVSARVAAMAAAALLFGLFGVSLPSSPHAGGLLTATPTVSRSTVIPVRPIDGLMSVTATVTLEANGLIGGERAQGGLTADLTASDRGSRITVSGPLLGPIAAQVGGSLVGLFTPSSVDIYKVPQGTYIVANGFLPLCVKPEAAQAGAPLEELSPQHLLGMLTNSEVARGRLVGQEVRNGRAVQHYVVNGEAFLEAARASSDPKLKSFAEALWSAEDADLYLDAQRGYPLAFRGAYSGVYDPLQFEGDFDVHIELTGINASTPVILPAACDQPIPA
jgi:hypothetical protein